MRGVLWRYLLGFGALLWGALCFWDYRYPGAALLRTSLHLQMLETEIEQENPKLTIWKGLGMVFITILLYYMKRFSTIKTPSISKLVSPRLHIADSEMSASVDDVVSRLALLMKAKRLDQRLQAGSPLHRRSPSPTLLETPSATHILSSRSVKPPTVDVRAVQEKLETLEKSVASMRERRAASMTKNTKKSLIDNTIFTSKSQFI